MPDKSDERILDVLLDSWERSNTILINLLHVIPKDDLTARIMTSSPSVAQLFTHMHFVRLVFIAEDAPEFAGELPAKEWEEEQDPGRIEQMLNESAIAVRQVVETMVGAGRVMQLHYDHPILFLQHMLWHEAYHHGQIKLTLKSIGHPLSDEKAGPLTWDVWMDKKSAP